jgi:hypothetical protein
MRALARGKKCRDELGVPAGVSFEPSDAWPIPPAPTLAAMGAIVRVQLPLLLRCHAGSVAYVAPAAGAATVTTWQEFVGGAAADRAAADADTETVLLMPEAVPARLPPVNEMSIAATAITTVR